MPIRFAILGFGHHARKRLVPAFARSQEAKLVGLWRRDPEAAAKDCAAYGIPHNFPSREALCASPEVDAVFITSPDAMHHADTLLAAAHGKAVLCEKPLSMNAGEAVEMEAAAARAGVLLGVAQHLRFSHSLQWMREAIATGRIGEPQLASAQFCYAGNRSPRRWITDGGLARGGPIGDVGIHCLDALRFVLGREVLSLQTLARGDKAYGSVDAVASIQAELTGGCLASITVSALAAYRTQIEVVGSEGALLAENGLSVDGTVTVELRRGSELVESHAIDNLHAYTDMIDSFARSMRTGEPFAASGVDGVTNMRVLDAAYKAWQSSRRETLAS